MPSEENLFGPIEGDTSLEHATKKKVVTTFRPYTDAHMSIGVFMNLKVEIAVVYLMKRTSLLMIVRRFLLPHERLWFRFFHGVCDPFFSSSISSRTVCDVASAGAAPCARSWAMTALTLPY